jgi:hypothetical protein
MSAVFFLGHKMAEEIVILGQNKFNFNDFILQMKTKYPYVKYRKMFEALEKIKL